MEIQAFMSAFRDLVYVICGAGFLAMTVLSFVEGSGRASDEESAETRDRRDAA